MSKKILYCTSFFVLSLFWGAHQSEAAITQVSKSYSDFTKGATSGVSIDNQGNVILEKNVSTYNNKSVFQYGTYYDNSTGGNYISTRDKAFATSLTDDGKITVKKEINGACIGQHTANIMYGGMAKAEELNLLFYAPSNDNIVHVVDTKGTVKEGDDVELGTYGSALDPSMPDAYIQSIYYINKLHWLAIYSQGNGVLFVDTKGTTTIADDQYLGKYGSSVFGDLNAAPWPLPANTFSYDETTDILYMGARSGEVIAMDTHGGSTNIGGHTRLFKLDTNSPASDKLAGESVSAIYYDPTSHGLYVASAYYSGSWHYNVYLIDPSKVGTGQQSNITFGAGANTLMGTMSQFNLLVGDNGVLYVPDEGTNTVKMVNLHNSLNPASFTVDGSFSLPGGALFKDIKLDKASNTLFVVYGNNLYTFDTTTRQQKRVYTAADRPMVIPEAAFNYDQILPQDGWMIITTAYGLCYQPLNIGTSSEWYFTGGKYESHPMDILGKPFSFSWNQNLGGMDANKVNVAYKLGIHSEVTRTFEDGDISGITDIKTWSKFLTRTTANGNLLLKNAQDSDSNADIDLGKPAGYFKAGSTIEVKFRTFGPTNKKIWFFGDEYTGSGSPAYLQNNNEWQTISFKETIDFSKIGVEMGSVGWTPDLTADDYIEIEYVKAWSDEWDGSWTTLGSDNTGTIITPDSSKNIVKTQFNLVSSPDQETSPIIESMTVDKGYINSVAGDESGVGITGTYVSEVIDAGEPVVWKNVIADITTPEETSYTLSARTGITSQVADQTWEEWTPLVGSDIGTTEETQFLQFKVDLGTSNPLVSPKINSVQITYIAAAIENNNSGSSSSNSDGSSSSPNRENVCTAQAAATPNLFQVRAYGNKATLYFAGLNTNVDRYEITYGNKNNKSQYLDVVYRGPSNGVLSRDINLLEPNTEYYFKMRASNVCAGSGWSKEIKIKTPARASQKVDFYPAKELVAKKVSNIITNTLSNWKAKLTPAVPTKSGTSAKPTVTPQVSEAPKAMTTQAPSAGQATTPDPKTTNQSWWQKIIQFLRK